MSTFVQWYEREAASSEQQGGNFARPEDSPLAPYWRPLIDFVDSPLAAIRLRNIPFLAKTVVDEDGSLSWFSILKPPKDRSRLLAQARLTQYDFPAVCTLDEEPSRSVWTRISAVLDAPEDVEPAQAQKVVALLNQLSLPDVVAERIRRVRLTADPAQQALAYEVARAAARCRPDAESAQRVLAWLSAKATDPLQRGAAVVQRIAGSLRFGGSATTQVDALVVEHMPLVEELAEDATWRGALVSSRLRRALGLYFVKRRELDRAEDAVERALAFNELVDRRDDSDLVRQLAAEDRKIILESSLKLAAFAPAPDAEEVERRAEALAVHDPYCVHTWLCGGEAWAAVGELRRAAAAYEEAGELGSVAGAIGWYRAAQCWEQLAQPNESFRCLRRCVALDPLAVQPRERLREWWSGVAGDGPHRPGVHTTRT
jgi:tetratricopeptide (TPR) repeat protein